MLKILRLLTAFRKARRATAAPPAPTPTSAVVAGANCFALDLYQALRARPGNLFFSPAGISTALAIAHAGARGATQRQMAKVLHFPGPPGQLDPTMGELVRSLKLGSDTPQVVEPAVILPSGIRMGGPSIFDTSPPLLRIANALWAAHEAPIHEGYRKTVEEHYGRAVHSLDFARDPDGSRRVINASVEANTAGRIRSLVGRIDPRDRLIVTNAVYLKASWAAAFDERATTPESFIAEGGRKISVPMMHKTLNLRYADNDRFQAIAIPYVGRELSMLIVLPRAEDGLAKVEAGLSADKLVALAGELHDRSYREIELTLPKFELEHSFELAPVLQTLGLSRAFSDNADFSGLSPHPVRISAVIHKTYVGVDENGTEAAAATAVMVRATSARLGPPPPPPVLFRADHPFLFAIRDDRSGLILFMGRLSEPVR